MDALPRDRTAVSRDAILAQLDKLVSSKAFEGSERSPKLLRYLVQQALKGETSAVKEYTLGVEVLGKSTSFDPRMDTIVRAEASRLRKRLEQYYASAGQADTILVNLPRGSYIPQFEARPASQIRTSGRRQGLGPLHERLLWFALGIAVAACVSGFVMWEAWRVPRTDSVSVAVLANRTEQAHNILTTFDGQYVGVPIATNAGVFNGRPCGQGRLRPVTLLVVNGNVTMRYNSINHLTFSGPVSDDGAVAISGQTDFGPAGILSGVLANGEFDGRTSGLSCNSELKLKRTGS